MNKLATFAELIEEHILEIGDGYRAKNDELGGRGPIFLRAAYLQDHGFISDMTERFKVDSLDRFGSKIAQLGDVVITTKGNSTGRIGVIRDAQAGSVYSPHLSYWRSRDQSKLHQPYLYYWSQSSNFSIQLSAMAFSTDMAPYLSLRDQLRLKITVPEIRIQQAIATVLGALDDKIELNRRMNETLEAMAQAIFRDWFVDFGPTRRQMADATDPVQIMGGLTPDPTKSATLAPLFPSTLAPNGLPEGWEESMLGDDFTIVMGQSPPGTTYNESGNGLPFFQGRRDFGFRFPTERIYCSEPTRIAEQDDTLVSLNNSSGPNSRLAGET